MKETTIKGNLNKFTKPVDYDRDLRDVVGKWAGLKNIVWSEDGQFYLQYARKRQVRS